MVKICAENRVGISPQRNDSIYTILGPIPPFRKRHFAARYQLEPVLFNQKHDPFKFAFEAKPRGSEFESNLTKQALKAELALHLFFWIQAKLSKLMVRSLIRIIAPCIFDHDAIIGQHTR